MAPAVEVDALPHYLKAGVPGDFVAELANDIAAVVGVGDAAAADADEVDVGEDVAFVAGLAGEREFLDYSAFGEDGEGGIDGGEGHRGEMLLDARVDLRHGGVVAGIEDGLGDGEALRGYAHAAPAQLEHYGILNHRRLPRR